MSPKHSNTLVFGAGFEVPREYDEDPALEAALRDLDLVEIIPENFFHGKRARLLEMLGDIGVPVVVHSVDMSVGEDAPFRAAHFDKIRRVIDAVNCVYFSDHICMTRAGGAEIGQLTTLPFTEEVVDVVCRNVDELRKRLGDGVALMLENITNRFVVAHNTLSETQFINSITRKSGVGLLLDVTNVYTNSVNFKFDPRQWINAIDHHSIEGIHLAGGEWHDGKLFDSHSRMVPSEVWGLYDYVTSIAKPRAVVVEWDQEPPPVADLMAEVARAARSMGRPEPASASGTRAGAERRFKSLAPLPEIDVLSLQGTMQSVGMPLPLAAEVGSMHEVAVP